MKRIGLPLAALLTTLSLTLTACGGVSSEDDIAEAPRRGRRVSPKEQADCIAKEVLDSDLSDDQLNAIAERTRGVRPRPARSSAEVSKVLSAAATGRASRE